MYVRGVAGEQDALVAVSGSLTRHVGEPEIHLGVWIPKSVP